MTSTMKSLLFSLSLLTLGYLMGYSSGLLTGEWRTVNATTAKAWARGHNEGCDDINAKGNFYTGKIDVVCEVQLSSKDEVVYIIREKGGKQ